VNFADLDLGDDADVTELRSRIEIIAKESCQQLSRMFPRPSDTAEIASCINRAVNSAEEQVRAAVAAAK
jgi:UrcA family protein